MPTLFLTATCSEPSFRSSGARYIFSRSSSFFSELASAMRISTLPTRASSLASAVCASAILNVRRGRVLARASGGRYHGGRRQLQLIRRAPQADAAGVAHQRSQRRCGGRIRTGGLCLEHVTPRPLVIAFTRRRRQAGIWGCTADDAAATACSKCIASSTSFCPRRRRLSAHLSLTPPRRAPYRLPSASQQPAASPPVQQTPHPPFRAREAPSEPAARFVQRRPGQSHTHSLCSHLTRCGARFARRQSLAATVHAQRACLSRRECEHKLPRRRSPRPQPATHAPPSPSPAPAVK
jgi:hypothetical protein